MEDITKNFNKTIKKLIDILDSELPNNSMVDSIKRKYTLAIMSDKSILLSEIGPELYNFRNEISDDSEWFRLIKSYDKYDNAGGYVINKISDSETETAAFKQMISSVKNMSSNLSDEEFKKIQTYFKRLLSLYCRSIVA